MIVKVNDSIVEDTVTDNETNSLIIGNQTSIAEQCSTVVVQVSATNDVGESERSAYSLFYPGGMYVIKVP